MGSLLSLPNKFHNSSNFMGTLFLGGYIIIIIILLIN
jgi:hypothetical protein